jgi:hypothetical protein
VGEMATKSVDRTESLPAHSEPRASRRDASNAWFVTHEVAWELAMAALAVIYVALGFLVDEVDAGQRPEIEAVELVLTGLFVLESEQERISC